MDDAHVAEHVGIAGVVNLQAIRELDYIPAGFATIDELFAILDAARVVSMHHGDFHIGHGLGSTFVHRRNPLCALLLQPGAEFIDANGYGIVLLGNLNCIADVVALAVGAEQDIHFPEIFFCLRAQRIAHDPGVHQDGLPCRRFNAKRGVAEPGKFDTVKFHWILDLR